MGILDEIVHSPNYPDKYPANLTCNWSIVLESNRAILAKFVDMDIEEAVSCAKDSITLVWFMFNSCKNSLVKLLARNKSETKSLPRAI